MSTITLTAVDKSFGATRVLSGLDLEVSEGEFVSLLGPSGCGKTTALRLVAGLDAPDRGTIRIGDRLVFDARTWVPPERRRIGMVFQSYAVWPHMNVLQNVVYPLLIQRVGRRERTERAMAILELVGLGGMEARRPSQLSGGQQQRVALARGLIMEPEVLLLDEPLSNLDAKLRLRMRRDIQRIQRETGFTVLYVTHDQEEALEISDRLAIMDRGEILALGSPDDVREHPFLVTE